MKDIDRKTERPLLGFNSNELVGLAKAAAHAVPADVDALLLCWDELEHRPRRNQRTRNQIKEIMATVQLGAPGEAGHKHRVGGGDRWTLRPISWFGAARKEARSLAPKKGAGRGHSHHVYVVLIGGFGRDGTEFGLYVGETSRRPEKRLEQHLNGTFAAGVVNGRGVCLLPSLFVYLNPFPRRDRKRREKELAEAFKTAFDASGCPKGHVKGGR